MSADVGCLGWLASGPARAPLHYSLGEMELLGIACVEAAWAGLCFGGCFINKDLPDANRGADCTPIEGRSEGRDR